MKKLTINQLLYLHERLAKATGGDAGLRDRALLESAAEAPFITFCGSEPYPTLEQKAARLGYGIIMNHPFVDGNKRTGAHAMLIFLALNGVRPAYTQEELANVILSVAASETNLEELTAWLTQRI